ncbi:MAG: ABC transporter ATP-binding protein [Clostridia bacterium]|nr:ABC transporter ATP-binding protein [Clostridia bacterium]
MEPILSVRDLNVAFTQGKRSLRPVTDGVSFDLYPGEILCLVGESGCGKSVSALALMGLLPRQGRVPSGTAIFDGRDLLALPPRSLDEVRGAGAAMIFQDIMYSLNPVLTIGTQMTEGMRRHLHMDKSAARQEAVRLLTKTGLPDPEGAMRKYPHQLSGGQRQRVMIAMALACRPKLLIADEPTTALDVTIQLQIMQLLRQLRDETGMAILLITHDVGVVAEMADRVVVMYAGQCVESAPAETLLTAPAHPYTRALMQAVPTLDPGKARLYHIPGAVPETFGDLPPCRFAPRCSYAADCPQTAEMIRLSENHTVRCARLAMERRDDHDA